MTRLQRLILDAVEKHGPDALVVRDVLPYVWARRWAPLLRGSIYIDLMQMEHVGLLTSRWLDEPPEALRMRGGLRRRAYSLAGGE